MQADSFAELTERVLGVAIEPALLAGWLHGKPGGADSGWAVTVEETQRAGTVDLAKRVSARRGEVVVRLVVDEYKALE